jgi:outer membrane protein assembly factor BamB
MNFFYMPRCSRCVLSPLALAFILTGGALFAADWPQWRGPERNGISQETGLLKEWPADGPKLVWQITDAGGGYSTPAVVGDRFYLLGNKGTEDEFVAARETSNGGQVWSTSLGKVGNPNQHPSYPGARSTPTVDGDSLYALSSDGDLACLALANGKIVWQKSLRKDFDGQPGQWAYAESPLVDGDTLVCTPGGATATVVALNKKSGDVIWKCAVPGGDKAGYSSVIISHATGVKQYVQFLAKGVVGIDAATGKFLWRYEKTAYGSMANIPTPLAVDNSVYSAAGKSGGGLVKLKSDEGKIDTDQAYFSPKLPTSIGGVVKVGDYMYGTNSVALMCVNFATGDIKWTDRSIGASSLVYAEGRLYLHGEKGGVALVEATPDAYHELGRFMPPKRPESGHAKAWAYPVIADGKLYIRELESVWCFDIRSTQATR